MKTIQTTLGQTRKSAKVDDEDFEKLNRIQWRYSNSSKGLQGTVVGKSIGLHRVVAGARPGEIVLFRNGDDTDCRRENLILLDAKRNEIPLRCSQVQDECKPVQTPEPTYKVTEYVNIEKPILVAPAPQPKFIDLTGKGHQVMGVDEIAWFELDDPAKAVVVLRRQMFDTHGGGARNVEFEYTGDEAQNVRIQALRLMDESGEKTISFCVELIDENKKLKAQNENQAKNWHELNKAFAQIQADHKEAVKALADDSEKTQLERFVNKLQAQVHALEMDRERIKGDMQAATHSYIEKEMAFAQEFIEVQAKHQRLVDKLKSIGFDVDTLMKGQ